MLNYRYLIIGGDRTADAPVHGLCELSSRDSTGPIIAESDPSDKGPHLSKELWQGRPIQYMWRKTKDRHLTLHLGQTAGIVDLPNRHISDNPGISCDFQKLPLATRQKKESKARFPLRKIIQEGIREQTEPDRSSRDFHSAVAVLLTLAICSMSGSVYAASTPAPEHVLSAVGLDGTDVKRLLNGEILSYSATEPTDKALSSGIVMYVRAVPSRLVDAIQRGALLARDPDVLAYGEIPAGAGVETFRRLTFTAGQEDEVRDLLQGEAGSEFNLSPQEIASIHALEKEPDAKRANSAMKAVSRQYRTILLQRVQAYQKAGPKGIAPYVRGNGTATDAGTELRIFTNQNKLLHLFAPDLQEVLLRYPAPLPAAASGRFLWLNRIVQGRPTVILFHRLIYTFGDAAVIVQNEFYAAHSFNAGQLVIGSVPFQGGTLLLYTHYSSSDHVAGLGRSLKHSIGRAALRKEMIKHFQRLKSALDNDDASRPTTVSSETPGRG